MDKDNNSSIDDILRRLKHNVENTESHDTEIKENTENLDTESLKERLKEQYSADDSHNTESAEKSDEYALDESFALIEEEDSSETLSTTEPVIEEIPELSEETVEETLASTSESELEEAVVEETPELQVEAEAEEAPEEALAEEIYSISPEYIEMIEELAEVKAKDIEAEPKTQETLVNEEDDVPWFDEAPLTKAKEESSSVIFIDLPDDDVEDLITMPEEEIISEEEISYDDNLDIKEISNEYFDETIPEGVYIDSMKEEAPLVFDESDKDFSFEEEEPATMTSSSDEEEESFYKTITTAEHETLAKRAAMRNLDEVMVDDSFKDNEIDGEYDFDGEEEKQILASNSEVVADGDIEDGVEEAFILQNSFEKKYGISTDFLDSDAVENTPDLADELHSSELEMGEDKDTEDHETVKSSIWQTLRPYALGVLAALILFFELLPPLGIVPDGLFDYTEHGVIYILFDMQLLFFAAALYWKKLFDGFMNLIRSTVNVYSILSLTVIIAALYSIVACFCTGSEMPKLYNSIVAIYIFVSYIIDSVDSKRVRRSIGELIAADNIFTLSRSHGKNSSADKMYLGGVAPDKNIYEPVGVSGTKYTKNFVNDRAYTKDKTVIYAVTPVIIFSLLIAVSAMMLGEDFSYVINSMTVTFLSLAPLSAIVSSFLPIFISYRRLQSRGCIIPSYRGAKSVADCDAIIFSDSHLFKDATSKDNGIKIYDQTKTAEVLSCLDTVYRAIGGPMEKVFSGANSSGKARKINIIRITRSGIEAVIDDRTSIILGSSDYLMRYGISTDFSADKKNSLGLLYVAMNSRLVASLSLSYKTEPLFEMLCELMGDNGIDTVIGTYDPVISSAFVANCRKGVEHDYPVSVVHKNKTDYYKKEKDDVSASKCGVFAISSRLKLVELAIFCKRIITISKIYSLIRSASFVFAVILSTIFTISGLMEYVNLLWVLVYQLLLVLSFFLVAHRWLPSTLENKKQ